MTTHVVGLDAVPGVFFLLLPGKRKSDVTNRFIHKGHVLGVAAFLALPLAIFLSRGLAVLFVAAAVFGLVVDYIHERRLPRLPRPFAVIFALVVGWGLLSAIWSITPGRSLYLNLPMAGTYLGGLVLVSLAVRLGGDERRFFETALVSGVCLGLVLLAIEISTPLALTGVIGPLIHGIDGAEYRKWLYALSGDSLFNFFNPGTMMAMLMVWPAAAILWRRGARALAMVLIAAALSVVVASTNGSPILGLTVGLAAFAAIYAFGRRAAWIFAVLLAAGIAAAPLIPNLIPNTKELSRMFPNLPSGVYPRVFIWHNVAALIGQDPLLGKGLDASRAVSRASEKIPFFGRGGTSLVSEPVPLHPHNAVLQLWLELGAVGATLLLAVMMALIRRIAVGVGGRVNRAACFGALFSVLTIANLNYGIWQSWWQGTLWLFIAFMAGVVGGKAGEED